MSKRFQRRRALVAIFLLGVSLRIAYALAIHEPSLVVYHGGDYTLYRIGAEQIASGDLSFGHDLFLLRPPLFPLMVALLGVDSLAVIAVNILLASCVIPLTWLLARQLNMSRRMSLLAALIVALDPTSLVHAGVLAPEPLANVLLAAGFVCLVAFRRAGALRGAVTLSALAGGCIALSALTRPAAFMLWLPMGLWLLAAAVGGGRLWSLLAFVAFPLLGYLMWTGHNQAAFGQRAFSTIGNWNLLYVRAASVEYQATRQPIDDVYAELAGRVEARLGNASEGVTAARRHHHYTGSAELQDALTSVALDVFREHPLMYLATMPVGAVRLLVKVSGGLHWLGAVWNVALLGLAALGIWRMIQARRWLDGLFLLLPCAYFVMGTLLVNTSAIDTRARVMVTPLLAVMAAQGVMWWLDRRRSVPVD